MSKTIDFYEALGDVGHLEREFGNSGVFSLYWSIRNFAMAFALAKKAGLSVKKVPSEYDIPGIARDEWPPCLKTAAGGMDDAIQFVLDVIENVADEDEDVERLETELKIAIREDLNAAIDEAEQEIKKAAA